MDAEKRNATEQLIVQTPLMPPSELCRGSSTRPLTLLEQNKVMRWKMRGEQLLKGV